MIDFPGSIFIKIFVSLQEIIVTYAVDICFPEISAEIPTEISTKLPYKINYSFNLSHFSSFKCINYVISLELIISKFARQSVGGSELINSLFLMKVALLQIRH